MFVMINNEPKANIQDGDHIGIAPRVINSIFNMVEETGSQSGYTYRVYWSFLQLYQEKILDLLNPNYSKKAAFNGPGLKLRWNKLDIFTVENLYNFECKGPEELMKYYHMGIKNKIVQTHNLNNASSRSHCIYTITLEWINPSKPDNVIVSKMQLVDLAGSERSSQTGVKDQMAKESIDINKSLFTLRQVITALTDSKSSDYIPYRDSKLTCLLRQSLGGNSYSLMISCLTPNDKYVEENKSTLNYASRASHIANKPVKNDDPQSKLVETLKRQVKILNEELIKANQHILDISIVRGEGGTFFGTEKVKNQFKQESQMLLTQSGFNIDPRSENMDDSSLPPLTLMMTPDKMRKLKTHTNQFFESDMKNKLSSNTTSPKVKKMDNENQSDTIRSKGLYNAEAAERIKEAKEAAFERIMHSANIVKEVLQRNMTLSEDLVKNNQLVDNLNQEIYQLQRENEDIRERLEILETITGKDSFELLKKIKGVNQTLDFEDQEDTQETEERHNRQEMKQFNEKELMVLLTDETNSDDFMIKNKTSIIKSIYQLSKEKHILTRRIENLEKTKIRKTHMKLRMTNNGFYNSNGDVPEEIRVRATLDEGVDDVEPIRSVLNEDELVVHSNFGDPRIRRGKKIKLIKQSSVNNDKRVLPFQKRQSSGNKSSKSEIRNPSSFNYGSNFGKTRESFLESESLNNSRIVMNPGPKNYAVRHAITQEELKSNISHMATNISDYNSGNSSAMNFDNSSMIYNPNRLKKSPYEIMSYEKMGSVSKPAKYAVHAKKYKNKRKY